MIPWIHGGCFLGSLFSRVKCTLQKQGAYPVSLDGSIQPSETYLRHAYEKNIQVHIQGKTLRTPPADPPDFGLAPLAKIFPFPPASEFEAGFQPSAGYLRRFIVCPLWPISAPGSPQGSLARISGCVSNK